MKASQDGSDWVTLHNSLINVMFRAYGKVLAEQKRLMCEEVAIALQLESAEKVPAKVAEIVRAFAPDIICLSDNPITLEDIVSFLEGEASSSLTSPQSHELWKKIKSVVDTFGDSP